jgi:RNA polymerase sigma-70 factor (ECF subfamily)
MSQECKWLKRCQQGDNEAFSRLYESHVQRIYDYVYFKTYHKETAEDITSTTFMKAFGRIQQFDLRKGEFIAWLYTIAKNEIVDFFRKAHPLLSLEDIWDIPSSEDVEIDAINRENFKSLQIYMQKLPACKRDILIMRIWQDLQFQEIAAILKKSEGQCKMIFYRMIKKMKQEVPVNLFLILMVAKHVIR